MTSAGVVYVVSTCQFLLANIPWEIPEISFVTSLGRGLSLHLPHAFLEPIHMQVPGVNLQANLLTNGRNQRLFLTSLRVARSKTLVASKKKHGEHVDRKGWTFAISVDPDAEEP